MTPSRHGTTRTRPPGQGLAAATYSSNDRPSGLPGDPGSAATLSSTMLSTATPAPTLSSGHASPPGWHIAWAQFAGPAHDRCEDSLAHRVFAGGGLALALADGVSGGARGDVASRSAVEHCVSDLPAALVGDQDGLARWLKLIEARVQLALRQVTFGSGATTLVAAWLSCEPGPVAQGWLVHVGDSRAYRLSAPQGAGPAQLQALTRDHNYAELGEPLPEGATPDDLARMIGVGAMGEPPLQPLRLAPGDALLLCSDGLHGFVTPAQLSLGLAKVKDAACADISAAMALAADALLAQAIAQGSRDDISLLWAQYPAR